MLYFSKKSGNWFSTPIVTFLLEMVTSFTVYVEPLSFTTKLFASNEAIVAKSLSKVTSILPLFTPDNDKLLTDNKLLGAIEKGLY